MAKDILPKILMAGLAVVAVIAIAYFAAMPTGYSVLQAGVGDEVRINYVLKLNDSSVFRTMNDSWTIGEPTAIAGLSSFIFEKEILGLQEGDTTTIELSWREAFGPSDTALPMTFQRYRTQEKYMEIPFIALNGTTKDKVEVGETVRTSLLPWPVLINKLGEKVKVEQKPVLNSIYYDPLLTNWPLKVTEIGGDTFTVQYNPKINSTIVSEYRELPGRVIDVNEESILVDFNHELAGKDLTFEVTILNITREAE